MVLAFGDHRLDIKRRELRRGDELIELEPKAFDLLAFLVQHSPASRSLTTPRWRERDSNCRSPSS